MKNLITKEWIEEMYHFAVLNFKGAINEDQQWEARKMMMNLEIIAIQEYGFNYCDQLHKQQLSELLERRKDSNENNKTEN